MKRLIVSVILSLLLFYNFSFASAISDYNQQNYILTYDGNGNLITGDGKYREYNEFNQLVRVRQGNSASGKILETYIYDPTGDRIIAKYTDYTGLGNNSFGDAVVYVNDNFERVFSDVTGSRQAADTYYARDDSGIVGEAKTNTSGDVTIKQYYPPDHLSSTSLITNESGGIVENIFYDPYGQIIQGGWESRYQYEGKEFSQATEDYDFHFRKYNPEIGIFTQPEQLFPNVYDPQQLNRYSFERRNPYKYVDETGKKATLSNRGMFFAVNSWFSAMLSSSLLRNWRVSQDFGSSNWYGKISIRSYDVLLKSQADISYWSFRDQPITGSVITSSFPRLSEENIWSVREDALFGAFSIAMAYFSALSTNTFWEALSGADTFSSILTGRGILENVYNAGNYGSYQINQASVYFDQYGQGYSGTPNKQTSVGTGSGIGGHDYSYNDPKDYPKDPQGRCVDPSKAAKRK